MKEQQQINNLSYLPISSQIIIEGLKGLSDEQIRELGVSEGVLFMIRQGFTKQLREDVFLILSRALGLDISADTPSPVNSPEK